MPKKNLFEMGSKLESTAIIEDISKVLLPNKHELVFLYEKRRGKPVTIVKPFYILKNDLKDTLKIVKKKLGTGGSIKDNMLEFQGEKKEHVQLELEKLGFRFRKKG